MLERRRACRRPRASRRSMRTSSRRRTGRTPGVASPRDRAAAAPRRGARPPGASPRRTARERPRRRAASRRSSVPGPPSAARGGGGAPPGQRASTSVPPSGRRPGGEPCARRKPRTERRLPACAARPSSAGTSTLAHPKGRAGPGSERTGWPGSVSRRRLPSLPSSASADRPGRRMEPDDVAAGEGKGPTSTVRVPRAPSHWTTWTGQQGGRRSRSRGPGDSRAPSRLHDQTSGGGRDRTDDLRIANATLSQLSYTPEVQGQRLLYAPRGACQRTPGLSRIGAFPLDSATFDEPHAREDAEPPGAREAGECVQFRPWIGRVPPSRRGLSRRRPLHGSDGGLQEGCEGASQPARSRACCSPASTPSRARTRRRSRSCRARSASPPPIAPCCARSPDVQLRSGDAAAGKATLQKVWDLDPKDPETAAVVRPLEGRAPKPPPPPEPPAAPGGHLGRIRAGPPRLSEMPGPGAMPQAAPRTRSVNGIPVQRPAGQRAALEVEDDDDLPPPAAKKAHATRFVITAVVGWRSSAAGTAGDSGRPHATSS